MMPAGGGSPEVPRDQGTHLVREAMRRALVSAIARLDAEGLPSASGRLVVLDVGGRGRPYLALLRERLGAARRPLDHLVIGPGPGADVRGVAESLPMRDGAAGLVLCTQVLEHVDRPPAAVAEMARVLAPGGACLLTTHGTWFYHPDPEDYWRWTSAGLRRLFLEAGLRQVTVSPVGGTKLALASLAITAFDRAGGGPLMGLARRAILPPANALASRWLKHAADRASVPGELAINYLVTARR